MTLERIGACLEGTPGSELLPAAVQLQLERIVASPEFIGSKRARSLLRFLVEETLKGRGERLKAYTIAVEVLDRDQTFDGQIDPIVRIEAGRLRRSLERYYLVAGQDDSIRIDIPKGRYIPTFLGVCPAAEAPVRDNGGDDPASPTADAAVGHEDSKSKIITRWPHHRRTIGLAALLSLLVVDLAWLTVRASNDRPRTEATVDGVAQSYPAGRPTAAVMPPDNLTADATAADQPAKLTKQLLSQVVHTAMLGFAGRDEDSSQRLALLLALEPEFAVRPRAMLNLQFKDTATVDLLLEGLRRAGLTTPRQS